MSRKDRRVGSGAPTIGGGPPPRSADHLFDLAVAHHQSGRLAEAESLYRDSLTLEPNHSDSLNCLGILAHQCGRNDAALELIGRAIGAQERNPQYHYNIALVLAASGRMDDAVTHNRRAIALKPDYTDAHTNLASALASQGKWSEAEVHFRRTLSQSQQSPQAYGNLAGALQAQGKQDEALGVLARGLAVAETDDLKAMFALCLQEQQSVPKIDRLRTFVERAITEAWARPSDLSNFATMLIKQSDTVRHAIPPDNPQAAASAQELFGPRALAALAGDRLLQALLVSTPICDVELERLLTIARHAVLDLAAASDKTAVSDDVLNACCALAQQCFINEYVFDGGAEVAGAKALREELVAALASGKPIAAVAVAGVACFVPLHSLPGAGTLLEQPWQDPVARLVTQQVREPALQERLRSSIPVLTAIDDSGVSAAVRQQYEENPSPRWVRSATLVRPLTIDDHIRTRFPQTAIHPLGKSEVEILSAGCGTGRDAIEMARWCIGVKMLAIDLSLASLSYARRKTEELGLGNIEYAQADLLKLDSLGRTFDVIDAIGVLHHLADANAGLRALASILRPGGFMRIGLNRAAGRDDVHAAQALIAERGYRPTADDIRRFRHDITGSETPAIAKAVTRYQEFFTTSECRDLLFPTQDRQFTIADIKTMLDDIRLNFVGFEDAAYGEYAKRHPEDQAMTKLDHWQALEAEQPAFFASMYVFWVQKPAEGASPG